MASTVVVPTRNNIQLPFALADALIDVATKAKADLDSVVLAAGTAYPALTARGVVDANVANLAAFTVAGNDGITYAAGDIVVLAAQTTVAQNGPYVVGAVGGGTAALSRPLYWNTGAGIPVGAKISVGPDGTLYKNTTWRAFCTKGKIVDTDDPIFYPEQLLIPVTLVAGTKTLGGTEGIWLKSTTLSKVLITRNTANTSTATTGGYAAPVASRVAGIKGTGAVVVHAEAADGTLNNADISTLDVLIVNA